MISIIFATYISIPSMPFMAILHDSIKIASMHFSINLQYMWVTKKINPLGN